MVAKKISCLSRKKGGENLIHVISISDTMGTP